jgi:hypothetical protein
MSRLSELIQDADSELIATLKQIRSAKERLKKEGKIAVDHYLFCLLDELKNEIRKP